MGVLGKDFFDVSDNFFEFTALFSNKEIQIFDHPYRCGEILTGFLNYDSSEYLRVLPELEVAYRAGGAGRYYEASAKLDALIAAMPLFQDFSEGRYLHLRADYGAHMLTEMPDDTSVTEKELFRNYEKYKTLAEDLKTIHERYSWFLKEIFYRDIGKSGDNKYAWQIEENGMSAFVSRRGLEKNDRLEPSAVIQYEVRVNPDTKEPKLFEKMTFHRLSDFIYVELFKGMLTGHVPKQCGNCSRWFLQEEGYDYEYCNGIAPGQTGKTCREIGARASFREKVKNNEIWKIHQRAYKKYYARVLKKTITKAQFNEWAQEAENLRDRALKESAPRMNHFDIKAYEKALNTL